MSDRQFNLMLEVVTLLLFHGFLLFLVPCAVLTFNIVGIEHLGFELSEEEKVRLGPYGYYLAFMVFAVPGAVLMAACFGIRRLLLRPEPPPEPVGRAQRPRPGSR